MIIGRFILRLLLVPLGACIALSVAIVLLLIANRTALLAVANADVEQQRSWFIALFAASPVLLSAFGVSALWMMAFAAIGVLFAETFAIRSWIFHAANGGLSALLGWAMIGGFGDDYRLLGDPKILAAAGLAAGLAYWLIAGWSAGFWKPVFAPPPVPMDSKAG